MLPNAVLGFLLATLAAFLTVSGFDVLGVRGTSRVPAQFTPEGFTPILTTAALVFTSCVIGPTGETAIVEVAREYLGLVGVVLTLSQSSGIRSTPGMSSSKVDWSSPTAATE